MFVTPFGWACTFLLVRENVVVDRPGGETFAKDTHKELVDT